MRFLIFLFLPALWAETDFPQAPGVYPPEESGSTRIPTVPRNPYQLEDHGESDNFLFYYEKDPEATKSTVPPLTVGTLSTETLQRVDPSERQREIPVTEYAYFPSLTTDTKVNKETALLRNESVGTTIGVSTPHLASSLPIQEVSSYSMGITPLVPEDPFESAKASGPTPPPTSNGLHYNVASPSFPEIDLKKEKQFNSSRNRVDPYDPEIEIHRPAIPKWEFDRNFEKIQKKTPTSIESKTVDVNDKTESKKENANESFPTKILSPAIEGNQLKYRVMQTNESKGWSSTANIAKKTETLQNERNRAHFNLNPVTLLPPTTNFHHLHQMPFTKSSSRKCCSCCRISRDKDVSQFSSESFNQINHAFPLRKSSTFDTEGGSISPNEIDDYVDPIPIESGTYAETQKSSTEIRLPKESAYVTRSLTPSVHQNIPIQLPETTYAELRASDKSSPFSTSPFPHPTTISKDPAYIVPKVQNVVSHVGYQEQPIFSTPGISGPSVDRCPCAPPSPTPCCSVTPCCIPTLPCCPSVPSIPCCPQPVICCQPKPCCPSPPMCCTAISIPILIPSCFRACPYCPCRRRLHSTLRLKRSPNAGSNCQRCTGSGQIMPGRTKRQLGCTDCRKSSSTVLHPFQQSSTSTCNTCSPGHYKTARVKRMGCLPCGRKKREIDVEQHKRRFKRFGCVTCLGRKKRSPINCHSCSNLGQLLHRFKRTIGCSLCGRNKREVAKTEKEIRRSPSECSCAQRQSTLVSRVKREMNGKKIHNKTEGDYDSVFQCDKSCCDYSRCTKMSAKKIDLNSKLTNWLM